MGAIERAADEILQPADAAAALRLSDEARWNQTLADWAVFMRVGTVFIRRAPDRRVVASAAILPYGAAAWVSMVLVTKDWRRRGLATALVNKCLAEADRAGWQAWLDATPDGAQVYAQLGFETCDELMRMRRPAREAATPAARTVPAALEAFIALDARALGIARDALLRDFAARPGSRLYGSDENACLVREGRRARQLGPVLAQGESQATRLLDTVLAAESGELIIDLHVRHATVRRHLAARGFVDERPFYRMARGPRRAEPDPRLAIASAGPEFG